MKKSPKGHFQFVLVLLLSASELMTAQNEKKNDNGFVDLFNGKDWNGWHLKLRNGDEEMAKEVYAIEDGMVHVFKDMPDSLNLNTGGNGTHGLFYTNKKYSKYILRFEYKWGKKITNNFDEWQYDAGCYYHVYDDKVWPKGLEYQVRYDHTKNRNHTGDFWAASTSLDWYSVDGKTFLLPKYGGKKWKVKRTNSTVMQILNTMPLTINGISAKSS